MKVGVEGSGSELGGEGVRQVGVGMGEIKVGCSHH